MITCLKKCTCVWLSKDVGLISCTRIPGRHLLIIYYLWDMDLMMIMMILKAHIMHDKLVTSILEWYFFSNLEKVKQLDLQIFWMMLILCWLTYHLLFQINDSLGTFGATSKQFRSEDFSAFVISVILFINIVVKICLFNLLSAQANFFNFYPKKKKNSRLL